MDTNASPTASSPMTARILGAAFAAAASLLLASFSIGPASAETAPQAARVTYSDLDLSTEAGARALLHRIDIAARSACGTDIRSPLFPRASANYRECVSGAVDTAVRQIDAPLVAALNKSQAGVSLAAR